MNGHGKKALGLLLGCATLASGSLLPLAASAEEGEKPLVHYSFDAAPNGRTIANEGSDGHSDATLEGDASVKDGRLVLTGTQDVVIPTGALKDKQDLTVSIWLKNNSGSMNTSAAYIGNADTAKGYFLLNPSNPAGRVKAVMTTATANQPNQSPWGTEVGPGSTGAPSSGSKSTGDMALYTTVISGSTGTMSSYLNGAPLGSSTYSIPQGGLGNYGDLVAYLGKSSYPDPKSRIEVDDYAIYDQAMDAAGVKGLYTSQALEKIMPTVAVPARASENFTLPTDLSGVHLDWASDSPALAVAGDGTVTVNRPASGQPDAKVTLTATFSLNGVTRTKAYQVSVPHLLSDQEQAQADLDAVGIENADDVRTNVSIPTVGEHGSSFTWSVKDPGTVGAVIVDGVNGSSKTVKVNRPAAGKPAATVVLSLEVRHGDSRLVKEFTLKVQPMPADNSKDQAYVWAFFTGEGVGGEKISLAASKGNNALDWNTLNNGSPLFTSSKGEQGLRDPFIMRSKDGDKFYMLATDLKISGRPNAPGGLSGFMGAQANGSKYIEIWESDDLTHWSQERHVKVSTDYAGNTWAPEAYYDAEIGKYVVYWASNLYPDTDPAERTALTYNRMMYVTTDDFINFSKPQVWIDVDRRGQPGSGSIDATVQKKDGTYYRVYKDEKTMTLRQEKSKDLLAKVAGSYPTAASGDANDWSMVGERIGGGQANGYGGTFSAGEGPSLFRANDGDVNGYQYYLFADQPNYHGGPNHYVPMATNNISKADQWKVIGDKMPEANFPTNTDGGKPRHGTVLPVTRAQYQKVLEAYAPHVAVTSVPAMSVETKVGQDPTPNLPAQVELTKADGSKEQVKVAWDAVDPSSYSHPGAFRVSGIAADASRMPVEVTVKVLSNDASLKSLTVAGQPVDLAQALAGTATLALADLPGLAEADIAALAKDDHATVALTLDSPGSAERMLTIKVTAADKATTRTYQVKLTQIRSAQPAPDKDNSQKPGHSSSGNSSGNASGTVNPHAQARPSLSATGVDLSKVPVLLLAASLGLVLIAVCRFFVRRQGSASAMDGDEQK